RWSPSPCRRTRRQEPADAPSCRRDIVARPSEARAETKLYYERLIRTILVRFRRTEQRTPLVDHERVEVLSIEHVKHLDDGRDPRMSGEPELALNTHIDTMNCCRVEP